MRANKKELRLLRLNPKQPHNLPTPPSLHPLARTQSCAAETLVPAGTLPRGPMRFVPCRNRANSHGAVVSVDAYASLRGCEVAAARVRPVTELHGCHGQIERRLQGVTGLRPSDGSYKVT